MDSQRSPLRFGTLLLLLLGSLIAPLALGAEEGQDADAAEPQDPILANASQPWTGDLDLAITHISADRLRMPGLDTARRSW